MIRKIVIKYTIEKLEEKAIRSYLKVNKISIRSLAKILGYSPTFMCDMINGKAYLSDKFHAWINENVFNERYLFDYMPEDEDKGE